MTLDHLHIHQKGIITDMNFEKVPLKLLDMGCLPGIVIEILHKAPLKDPIYICVNDSHISIRRELAKEIQVELIDY